MTSILAEVCFGISVIMLNWAVLETAADVVVGTTKGISCQGDACLLPRVRKTAKSVLPYVP